MASGIVIVPGKNPVLQRIAQHLADFDGVQVLDSANAVLWLARRTPPAVVLADVALDDMSGAELAEILPTLAPQTRLVLSGPSNEALARVIHKTNAQLLTPGESLDHNLWTLYQTLGIAPPAPRPGTGSLPSPTPEPALRNAPAAVPTPSQSTLPPRPPATVPAQPVTRQPQSGPTTRPIPASITNAAPTIGSVPKPLGGMPKASTPAPTTAPVPAPARDPFAVRKGPLIIRPQQESKLRALLKTLVDDVSAQSVMLSDTAGMVLLEVGQIPNIMTHSLGPLLATSFSTETELSRQLREQESNALYLHEGTNYDIYAVNVGYRFILTLIFDKHIGVSKLGSVWVYAKRVTRQLQLELDS